MRNKDRWLKVEKEWEDYLLNGFNKRKENNNRLTDGSEKVLEKEKYNIEKTKNTYNLFKEK